MRPEVREFKDKAKLFMPPVKLSPELPASITMTVQTDWYYKNGKMRKLDVQNLAKVVVDFVCEKAGVDDNLIWEFTARKKQAPEREGVEVTIVQFQKLKTGEL